MFVYLPTERDRRNDHTIYVTPGADAAFTKGEVPAEWKDQEGKPLTITVKFIQGKAEVPKNLGEYMVERGLARKTALIRPGDRAYA